MVEDRDRGDHLLLPRAREHLARADLGPPGVDRADASYAAGEVEIFRRVRIPNALPYIFSALKVATVLAMIGAIVGDYFGGSQDSLGIVIRRDAGIFAFEHAWAAIVVASVLGILFYAAVASAERLVMRWHPSTRIE